MSKNLVHEIEGLLPKKVTIKIEDDLIITEDIDWEVDNAAKNFGYYAVLSERAESRYQKYEAGFKTWIASEESKIILSHRTEGLKLPTEAQMKAHIRSQPKYEAWQDKLIQLDEQRRILKIIVKAFEIKANLIQTKASNRRSEAKASVRRY